MELLHAVQTAALIVIGLVLAYCLWRLERTFKLLYSHMLGPQKQTGAQQALEKRVAELEARLPPKDHT